MFCFRHLWPTITGIQKRIAADRSPKIHRRPIQSWDLLLLPWDSGCWSTVLAFNPPRMSPLNIPLSSNFIRPTNRQVGASLQPDQGHLSLSSGSCLSCLIGLDAKCTYLCGNSLGLMSKRSKALVEEELDVWSTR
jgi:hypothetical protein